MNILKQSTAATIKLGAFVDDTDGKTAETALTIGQADIRLSKNGGDIAQSHNTAGATHDELGYYDIPLDTTDTGTLGRLRVLVSKAGALPVWQDFVVVTANVYDSMFSTDKLDVAVVEMATDVLTAAAVKADAVTKIQSGLATPTNITAGTITTVTNLTNLPTMPIDWISSAGISSGAALYLGAIVWAKLLSENNTAGSFGKAIADILGDTNELQTDLVNDGRLDLLIDAIKAKSDLIPATPAEAGEYTDAIAAVKSVADDILVDTGTTLDTLVKDIPTNAELATALGTADDAVLAALATTDGKVDSILEDTGTTLDTLIKDIPTNAELATALGTADDAVLAAVAAAKVVIDDIHDTDLPAVKAETALIVEDTGTTIPATLATLAGYTDGIAGDVWSHATRTLTNQGIDAASPAAGDQLIIYRDSTVGISLTGLADSTNSTKMWFTVKENLEDTDESSILQILFTNAETHTDTLLYVNKAAPISADNGGFVVADHTDGTASITLAAAEAANLPIYAATPLYWDVKMLTAAGVTILSTGTMYIYGTPTRTII